MQRPRIRRPSPALVIACLALAVALTGTSYATVLNVPRKSVGTLQMKRGAVGTAQLKRNAVKARQLAPNAVRSAHVLNGSLLAADFKPGQIPQGPKGDKGDKGDTGPVGISELELVRATSVNNSISGKGVNTSCPGGKRVLGGGAIILGPGAVDVVLTGTQPTSLTMWSASAREINPTDESWQVRVALICAKVAS